MLSLLSSLFNVLFGFEMHFMASTLKFLSSFLHFQVPFCHSQYFVVSMSVLLVLAIVEHGAAPPHVIPHERSISTQVEDGPSFLRANPPVLQK
ncbi:hypothetical protein B0O99DRAFT_129517 [Bisporella sp. PMI_857]|nr:hypothetical protein B0O99DRAFT_129517 [Bisporella sp. PMI_857]